MSGGNSSHHNKDRKISLGRDWKDEVDCQYEIKECEKIIAKEKTINTLLTLYLEIDQQQQYYTDFNNLVNYAKSTMRKLEIAEKTYETKHEEFEKNFPDVCPLCDKPK